MPKYVFKNGVLKQPEATSNTSLPVVSSVTLYGEHRLVTSPSTETTFNAIQEFDYQKQFSRDEFDILDEMSVVFGQLGLSLALVEKIRQLEGRHLHFWIDDSGSMTSPSDVPFVDAHPEFKKQCESSTNKSRYVDRNMMTRWGEAENRLHIMMDLLAYIPTGSISFTFINHLNDTKTFDAALRKTMLPSEFRAKSHEEIRQAFAQHSVSGYTPLKATLSKAFKNSTTPMVHYLLTDGVPTDGSIDDLKRLIHARNAPMNPLSLISCTNNTSEVAYFKQIDQTSSFVSETDDYTQECLEVQNSQGKSFPFSRGLWILMQLIGPLDNDLDNLDENKLLSRDFIALVLGYQSSESYAAYEANHPSKSNAKLSNHTVFNFKEEPEQENVTGCTLS